MSLPSWERGLKCIYVAIVIHSGIVAPLVGAWIEMLGRCHRLYLFVSLPSWERGLKSSVLIKILISLSVAPLVGAWIEIPFLKEK